MMVFGSIAALVMDIKQSCTVLLLMSLIGVSLFCFYSRTSADYFEMVQRLLYNILFTRLFHYTCRITFVHVIYIQPTLW